MPVNKRNADRVLKSLRNAPAFTMCRCEASLFGPSRIRYKPCRHPGIGNRVDAPLRLAREMSSRTGAFGSLI
jgi:hypothetical protein